MGAPSGTTLSMGEVVAKTLGRNLKKSLFMVVKTNWRLQDRNTISFATVELEAYCGRPYCNLCR